MSISTEAVKLISRTARTVGFSHRDDDYSWLADNIVSAGDYKGDSTAAVVFHDRREADLFADRIRELIDNGLLDAISDSIQVRIFDIPEDGYHSTSVVVLTGGDITTKADQLQRSLEGIEDATEAVLQPHDPKNRPGRHPIQFNDPDDIF